MIRSLSPMARLVPALLMLATWALPSARAELPSTVSRGATLKEVFSSAAFHEGPTWDPATGKLYFTAFFGGDEANQQIIRLDATGKGTVWLDKSEGVNGTWLSLEINRCLFKAQPKNSENEMSVVVA